jgi:hypothetical protein
MSARLRLTLSYAAFLVAATSLLLPSHASAQTCDSPIQLPLSPARPSTGTQTCTQGAPEGLHLCNGSVVTSTNFVVFSLTVNAGNTASLMATATGMQPYFYLTGPACADGACLQGPGYLSLVDVAPGDYSLIVTSSPIDAGDACGPVTLLLDGDLTAGDPVFANSFE